jgi:hypothetical protein
MLHCRHPVYGFAIKPNEVSLIGLCLSPEDGGRSQSPKHCFQLETALPLLRQLSHVSPLQLYLRSGRNYSSTGGNRKVWDVPEAVFVIT